MSDPKSRAITCDAVRAICEADGKDYAVLIARDRAAGTFQYTTWGKAPADKAEAAACAEWLSDRIDANPTAITTYESFVLDAAQVKADLEAARAVLSDLGCRLNTLAEVAPPRLAVRLRGLAGRALGAAG
jgi:hypothetical protein